MKKLITILAAIALVCAFTLPAAAADWNFYGSARVGTWWTTVNPPNDGDRDTDLDHFVQGNSRIGANVKAGDVSGRFEYGTGINLRLLYGDWNFGAGTLRVGQAYTPINYFPSNQVYNTDTDLLPYGGIYRGRRALVQLQFGTFKFAMVQPEAAGNIGFYMTDPDTGAQVISPDVADGDVDIILPQFEVSYKFKTDMFYVDLFGGYLMYNIEPRGDANFDESIRCYIIGTNLGATFGPVAVKASIYGGGNMGPYGMWQAGNNDPIFTAGGIEDNTTVAFLGVVTFKATDMLAFEVGYGKIDHDRGDAVEKDDTQSIYANAVVTFAPGVFIVPEIGQVDYGNNFAGAEEGDDFYLGLKWQINF
jgi:hypothetical protein